MESSTIISQGTCLNGNPKKSQDDTVLKRNILNHTQDLERKLADVIKSQLQSWKEEHLSVVFERPQNNTVTNGVNHRRNRETTPMVNRKMFSSRESPLTDLLEMNHIRSIYNAFAGILFILFLQQLMEEVLHTGSVDLKLSYLFWAFGETFTAVTVLILMNLITIFVVYGCLYIWAHHRHKNKSLSDGLSLTLYGLYLFLFIYFPPQTLIKYQFPPASSIVILCEQVRQLMKTWAFIRVNVPRALAYKKDDNSSKTSPCSAFENYVYFLFAPTLVYRDQYPRTPSIRWNKVALHFWHVLGCLLFIHFLLTKFCPTFQSAGTEPLSITKLLTASFFCSFPSFLVFLCGFFLLLHSWMNAFAELLQFGDRMFYKDWWNSTSFPGFYRTWNCIVHDWLYEYVYIEVSQLQKHSNGLLRELKFLPMLSVFFISSVVHEYILSFAFKFFYPVLLVMFGFLGLFLMFFRTRASFFNAFIWFSLIWGTGILMCLYSFEWYARANCLPTFDGFADYLVPRSWFCST